MNYIGIFLISAATLLFELTLTRVFSVLFYHHFAFLIISTALFGFGFSGIYLFFFSKKRTSISRKLFWGGILFSLSIVIVYRVILLLPYGFRTVMEDPWQIYRLLINYLLLAIPFFFSGYVIGTILNSFPQKAGRYYAFDLVGAALGCVAALFLVPEMGAAGSIVCSAALAACSSIFFAAGSRIRQTAGALVAAVLLIFSPGAEVHFPLPMSEIFMQKHGNFLQAPRRKIEFSAWSPVSRIDVLRTPRNRLIYLDGGSNVSFLMRFNGNFKRLEPRRTWRTVPYLVSNPLNVCIIGPGGGEDVLNALSHRPKSITAVELDPLMVKVVRERYSKFIGGIFDHPSVRLINDEGRSFLRRSEQKFDLIQTVHNCSPMALAAGALNLSESYLFTVEAFREYWNRLSPEGILAINRGGILRAASVASVMLEQEGIPDPESFVVVTTQRRGGGGSGFYLKKGRILPEEIRRFEELQKDLRFDVRYAPHPRYQKKQNYYYRLLKPSLRDDFIREADLVLGASTDNWPFFEHYQPFGQFRTETKILPGEFNRGLQYWNLGDLALFALLAEAALLSFLFLIAPLLRLRKIGTTLSNATAFVYFSALGLGFILIEISLFQKHILFMGQPVYSIASVLSSLLLSAGAGSLFFQYRFREEKQRSWLFWVPAGVLLTLLFEVLLVPRILDYFLGAEKTVRFLLSGFMLAPLGFFLGIPFPMGIHILGKRRPELIPWAWGLNAYMTVVGSILCVIFALTMGFIANFLIAAGIYILGFAAFSLFVFRPALSAPSSHRFM